MYKPAKSCNLHVLFGIYSNGSKFLVMSWFKSTRSGQPGHDSYETAKTRTMTLHQGEDELSAKLQMVGDALHKIGKKTSITIHTNDNAVYQIIDDHDHEKPTLRPEWGQIAGSRNIRGEKSDLNMSDELQIAERLLRRKINSLSKGSHERHANRQRFRLPENSAA